MGLAVPEPPEHPLIAIYVISAFRVIERSRHYFEVTPKPIDIQDIVNYLEWYESPCSEWLFVECIFALDNLYLEKAYKKMSKKSA